MKKRNILMTIVAIFYIAIVVYSFFFKPDNKTGNTVLLNKDSLQLFISNTYKNAYIDGANAATNVHNLKITDPKKQKDFIRTSLFKDSSIYSSNVVITDGEK